MIVKYLPNDEVIKLGQEIANLTNSGWWDNMKREMKGVKWHYMCLMNNFFYIAFELFLKEISLWKKIIPKSFSLVWILIIICEWTSLKLVFFVWSISEW